MYTHISSLTTWSDSANYPPSPLPLPQCHCVVHVYTRPLLSLNVPPYPLRKPSASSIDYHLSNKMRTRTSLRRRTFFPYMYIHIFSPPLGFLFFFFFFFSLSLSLSLSVHPQDTVKETRLQKPGSTIHTTPLLHSVYIHTPRRHAGAPFPFYLPKGVCNYLHTYFDTNNNSLLLSKGSD